MQTAFRVGLFHSQPIVLKRQLLPLCLGHVYTLMVCESPFILGGRVSIQDALLTVGICSASFAQGIEWLRSDARDADCSQWGKECRNIDIPAELDKLAAYLDEHVAIPERWATKGNKPSQCPWPITVAASIMPLVGEIRAWNMPLALAMSYQAAVRERDGDDTLKTDADMELIERAYREQQEREAS